MLYTKLLVAVAIATMDRQKKSQNQNKRTQSRTFEKQYGRLQIFNQKSGPSD